MWIKFLKPILSGELIWINSCKAIVSYELGRIEFSETDLNRIKTNWDTPMSGEGVLRSVTQKNFLVKFDAIYEYIIGPVVIRSPCSASVCILFLWSSCTATDVLLCSVHDNTQLMYKYINTYLIAVSPVCCRCAVRDPSPVLAATQGRPRSTRTSSTTCISSASRTRSVSPAQTHTGWDRVWKTFTALTSPPHPLNSPDISQTPTFPRHLLQTSLKTPFNPHQNSEVLRELPRPPTKLSM